jgi:hypothetical protein
MGHISSPYYRRTNRFPSILIISNSFSCPHLLSGIGGGRDKGAVHAAPQYQIPHGKVTDQSGKDCGIKESHRDSLQAGKDAIDYRGHWYDHPEDDYCNPEQR